MYNVETTPREFSSMVMLVRDALLEMKKVLDYTGDVAANYMKMEARCRKIYVFEERGDEFYREEIRRLFTEKQSAAYMIYWKDILVDVERMLDAAAGAATLLQKLFVQV